MGWNYQQSLNKRLHSHKLNKPSYSALDGHQAEYESKFGNYVMTVRTVLTR